MKDKMETCPDCGHGEVHCYAGGCNHDDCDCASSWDSARRRLLTIAEGFAESLELDEEELEHDTNCLLMAALDYAAVNGWSPPLASGSAAP
jgi:hypothetical protein